MDATDIVYISAEVIVGLITVIGNSLVLAAIVKTQRLHTITNVFVGNLAVADIAVGVLVAPCAALSFMGLPTNFYGCVFINCLILTFTNVSILMLLAVAIERFLAIKEPFLYRRLLGVRRAVLVNLFVWVLGCVLGLVPMYGWHGGHRMDDYCRFTDVITYEYMVYFQFFGLVLLPLFIMLCIYIYILIIVRRHMKQTSALQTRFQQNSDGFSKDVRAAKMFALVILMFAIFWFPVNIFNCISLFCGTLCNFPKQALLAAIVMSHANSSINPFLYATSNSRIKGAIKGLFGFRLNPDERSSTDPNYARNTPNGTPHARENTMTPVYNVHERSNCNNDVQSFAVLQDKVQSPILKMSDASKEEFQGVDEGTALNNIPYTTANSDSIKNGHINNTTPNHSLHSSFLSLSSISKDDDLTEGESPVLPNPLKKTEQYSYLDDITDEDCIRLSNTPPSSITSLNHLQDNHKFVSTLCNGHSNLAFINSELLTSYKDHSNCDKAEDFNIRALFVKNQKGISETDALRSKHKNWCEERTNERHSTDTAEINNTSPKIPSKVNKMQDLGSSSDSNEVLLVKITNGSLSSEDTTLSSLSGHRSVSTEKLELSEFSLDDPNVDYNGNSEIHKGHKNKDNKYYNSCVIVDEKGKLQNAKTEQTKL